jgi:tetratricopeptide (TPR) repeat protein
MSRIVSTLIVVLIFPFSGGACLWDRDTLAEEASGDLDLINVIVGRFPRNPPEFYEVRLARVEKELAAEPENLALYDDAGVACDRLGRSAEAVAWMEKKAAVLEGKDDEEQRYRYHANLGTFLVHGWLHDGAPADDVRGEQGAEHIRQAIAINPDAHFGRETVQLLAIEWILKTRKLKQGQLPPSNPWNMLGIHGRYGMTEEFPNGQTPAYYVKGLSGMVALGSAWESVDIFDMISRSLLAESRSSVAYLAALRVAELREAGHVSLSELANEMELFSDGSALEVHDHLEDWYRRAREAADTWQKARTDYLLAGIQSGRHPDTDTDFWKGFRDSDYPLPELSDKEPRSGGNQVNLLLSYTKSALLIIAGGVFLLYLLRRCRKARV